MFEVETYWVSSYPERFTGETRPSRTLELTGPLPCHGIRNRATLAFSPSFDGVWSSPVAGYLTDGGLAGLSVVGWFPLAEYPFYYDILRSGRPVNVLDDFQDAGATSGSLCRVGLGTFAERVGEGPSDSDASIGATRRAVIVALREGVVPMPTAKDLPQRAGEDGGELPRACGTSAPEAHTVTFPPLAGPAFCHTPGTRRFSLSGARPGGDPMNPPLPTALPTLLSGLLLPGAEHP